jgi:hypothetical protein
VVHSLRPSKAKENAPVRFGLIQKRSTTSLAAGEIIIGGLTTNFKLFLVLCQETLTSARAIEFGSL